MQALALNTDAATLSPIALFLQADIIVKIVMIGLLLASIWTWTIIVGQWLKLRNVGRETRRFERDFETQGLPRHRADGLEALRRRVALIKLDHERHVRGRVSSGVSARVVDPRVPEATPEQKPKGESPEPSAADKDKK